MMTSSTPITAVPTASQPPLSVIRVSATPNEREDQADQRAEVLQQHHRQLGRLGPADESTHDRLPAHGFDSWIAVRKEKPSRTIATSSTTTGTHCRLDLVGVGHLCTPRRARTGRRR